MTTSDFTFFKSIPSLVTKGFTLFYMAKMRLHRQKSLVGQIQFQEFRIAMSGCLSVPGHDNPQRGITCKLGNEWGTHFQGYRTYQTDKYMTLYFMA